MRWALATLALAACASDDMPRQRVQLASLTFDVPVDWTRTDMSRRGVSTALWTPRANERRETITIVQSELAPATAAAGQATLENMLLRANDLPQARVGAVEPVKTQQGLEGARVELDFIPPGSQLRYHRVHVVLVDGDALVHVLYTALDPDGDALRIVLASIHHGEAS